jgi:TonB family protein
VLDVVFEAGGVVRVLGVAQGLGHGLDQAAIDAAKKIRFNPARRDGAPVDHAAKLRVVFRLA